MKNLDIRQAAAEKNMKLWQIADCIGIADSQFSRRLRKELIPKEKERIFSIIDNFKEDSVNE